jgi:hypothetical protein
MLCVLSTKYSQQLYNHVIAMPSMESIINTREFIYIHIQPALYAGSHCACHSCRPPASNAGRRRPSAARSSASSASACLLSLARVSARVKASNSLQPSIQPTRLTNTSPSTLHHPPSIPPAPFHPLPVAAIAASLRQHLRLCVPSSAYQSYPKHACRSKGWRCFCDHRASTPLLSSASIHIAPPAISPGSPHHRLTSAIVVRDPSIDPQMAP